MLGGKRAQLGKPKLGRDLPAHEDDAFGFERGDAAQKHPGVDRLFRFAVPIGVTVQRPERMAPLGERHIPEQPAQEVAVRGVGVAAQIPAEGRIGPDQRGAGRRFFEQRLPIGGPDIRGQNVRVRDPYRFLRGAGNGLRLWGRGIGRRLRLARVPRAVAARCAAGREARLRTARVPGAPEDAP